MGCSIAETGSLEDNILLLFVQRAISSIGSVLVITILVLRMSSTIDAFERVIAIVCANLTTKAMSFFVAILSDVVRIKSQAILALPDKDLITPADALNVGEKPSSFF